MHLSRAEVAALLRGFISHLQIDPHDAGLVLEQVPDEGLDTETLGDLIDGQGYPELASLAYATAPEVG